MPTLFLSDKIHSLNLSNSLEILSKSLSDIQLHCRDSLPIFSLLSNQANPYFIPVSLRPLTSMWSLRPCKDAPAPLTADVALHDPNGDKEFLEVSV